MEAFRVLELAFLNISQTGRAYDAVSGVSVRELNITEYHVEIRLRHLLHGEAPGNGSLWTIVLPRTIRSLFSEQTSLNLSGIDEAAASVLECDRY